MLYLGLSIMYLFHICCFKYMFATVSFFSLVKFHKFLSSIIFHCFISLHLLPNFSLSALYYFLSLFRVHQFPQHLVYFIDQLVNEITKTVGKTEQNFRELNLCITEKGLEVKRVSLYTPRHRWSTHVSDTCPTHVNNKCVYWQIFCTHMCLTHASARWFHWK